MNKIDLMWEASILGFALVVAATCIDVNVTINIADGQSCEITTGAPEAKDE